MSTRINLVLSGDTLDQGRLKVNDALTSITAGTVGHGDINAYGTVTVPQNALQSREFGTGLSVIGLSAESISAGDIIINNPLSGGTELITITSSSAYFIGVVPAYSLATVCAAASAVQLGNDSRISSLEFYGASGSTSSFEQAPVKTMGVSANRVEVGDLGETGYDTSFALNVESTKSLTLSAGTISATIARLGTIYFDDATTQNSALTNQTIPGFSSQSNLNFRAGFNPDTTKEINFITSGHSRMVITDSGHNTPRVGIGRIYPAFPLDVAGGMALRSELGIEKIYEFSPSGSLFMIRDGGAGSRIHLSAGNNARGTSIHFLAGKNSSNTLYFGQTLTDEYFNTEQAYIQAGGSLSGSMLLGISSSLVNKQYNSFHILTSGAVAISSGPDAVADGTFITVSSLNSEVIDQTITGLESNGMGLLLQPPKETLFGVGGSGSSSARLVLVNSRQITLGYPDPYLPESDVDNEEHNSLSAGFRQYSNAAMAISGDLYVLGSYDNTDVEGQEQGKLKLNTAVELLANTPSVERSISWHRNITEGVTNLYYNPEYYSWKVRTGADQDALKLNAGGYFRSAYPATGNLGYVFWPEERGDYPDIYPTASGNLFLIRPSTGDGSVCGTYAAERMAATALTGMSNSGLSALFTVQNWVESASSFDAGFMVTTAGNVTVGGYENELINTYDDQGLLTAGEIAKLVTVSGKVFALSGFYASTDPLGQAPGMARFNETMSGNFIDLADITAVGGGGGAPSQLGFSLLTTTSGNLKFQTADLIDGAYSNTLTRFIVTSAGQMAIGGERPDGAGGIDSDTQLWMTGSMSAESNVSAAAYYGSGYFLTDLPASVGIDLATLTSEGNMIFDADALWPAPATQPNGIGDIKMRISGASNAFQIANRGTVGINSNINAAAEAGHIHPGMLTISDETPSGIAITGYAFCIRENDSGGEEYTYFATGGEAFVTGKGQKYKTAGAHKTDGIYGAIVGGQGNTLSGAAWSFIGAGKNGEIQDYYYGAVVGGLGNVLSGGYDAASNAVVGCGTMIGGEDNKSICANHTFMAGGRLNTIHSDNVETSDMTWSHYSSIIGGHHNKIDKGFDSGIYQGEHNTISGQQGSIILGGSTNTISGAVFAASEQHQNNNIILAGRENWIFQGYDQDQVYGANAIMSSENVTLSASHHCAMISSKGPDTKISHSENSLIIGCQDHTNITGGERTIIINSDGGTRIIDSDRTGIYNGYRSGITASNYSAILAGNVNSIDTSWYARILGGKENSISGGGLAQYGTILGGEENITVCAYHSNILGGYQNIIRNMGPQTGGYFTNGDSRFSTIVNGSNNLIDFGFFCNINGGEQNVISGAKDAVIGGGVYNTISGAADGSANRGGFNVIAGGGYNGIWSTITDDSSPQGQTIGGGFRNRINGWKTYQHTIAGGHLNVISGGKRSVIGGGYNNAIEQGDTCNMGGGEANRIRDGYFDFIGGGYGNNLSANTSNGSNSIAGGRGNYLTGSEYAVIGGGINNSLYGADESGIFTGEAGFLCASNHSVIVGGKLNRIEDGDYSSIVAGASNKIHDGTHSNCFIGGGSTNIMLQDCKSSAIIAGEVNTITGSDYSVLAGGYFNTISGEWGGFIGAGQYNELHHWGLADAWPNSSVIVGGQRNAISGGTNSSIVGGSGNKIGRTSLVKWSFIGGGQGNIIYQEIGHNQNPAPAGYVYGNSSIVGGFLNSISGAAGHVICGGERNKIRHQWTLPDQYKNEVGGGHFLGGGNNNGIYSDINGHVLVGGLSNLITSKGTGGPNRESVQGHVIVGGGGNQIKVPAGGGTYGDYLGMNTIVGGYGNKVVSGGRNFIGGGGSTAPPPGNTISGGALAGTYSKSGAHFNVIAGGQNQEMTASGDLYHLINNSCVGGGGHKLWGTQFGVIAGGKENKLIHNTYSTIAGGYRCVISGGDNSFIGGGLDNSICSANNAVLGGGTTNKVWQSTHSVLAGGSTQKLIKSSVGGIFCGSGNTITGTSYCVILGGLDNRIFNSTLDDEHGNNQNPVRSTILNGLNNYIRGKGEWNQIFNGNECNITNKLSARASSVKNTILNGTYGMMKEAHTSTILNSDTYVTISGGGSCTILGGGYHYIAASGATESQHKYNLVGQGGSQSVNHGNRITGAMYCTALNGNHNVLLGRSDGDDHGIVTYCSILNGESNNVSTGATYSTIVGGKNNLLGNSSDYSVIGGGLNNTLTSSNYASILGGEDNDTAGYNNVHILGSDIVATQSNTTYTEDLIVGGTLGAPGGTISVTGDLIVGGTLTELSTMHIKENITPINNSLDKVAMLKGVEFDYKDSKKHSIGLVAEEVQKVVPELVGTDSDGNASSVAYQRMVPLLIESVKELRQLVLDQEAEIKKLKDKQ